MAYAPSKGFRASELARDRKMLLPVELDFPKNMLAETSGVPEPEGLRETVHVWSDGSPLVEPVYNTWQNSDGSIEQASLVHKETWNRIAAGLRALTGSKHAVHEERKLSRNQQKAARQRVKTLVVGRARWLIAQCVEFEPRLTKHFTEAELLRDALEIAESQFVDNLALQEDHGFDIDMLVYKLQDNSKTKHQVTK